ncbi:UNVERIFIED_CONTAM: hypothetical protein HDU68_011204, partial [Siphonaria sp. JEL0065]
WNQKYIRYFEVFIFMLILGVGVCFMVLLPRLGVDWGQAFFGYLPSSILVSDSTALYTCLGILGATVMPHNLYLHSSLVHFKSPAYRERLEMREPSKTKLKAEQSQQALPASRSVSNPSTPPQQIRRDESANTIVHTPEIFAVTSAPRPQATANDTYGATQEQSTNQLLSLLVSQFKKPSIRALPDHQLPLLKKCLHYLNVDSFISLIYATMVNSFILITAAAAFYNPNEPIEVAGIEDAYHLLWQQLGKGGATVFAIGLLFSGQCSTITGTLAGQVVMEGFLGGGDTLATLDDVESAGDDKVPIASDSVAGDGFLVSNGATASPRSVGAQPTFTAKMLAFFKRNLWARRLITRGLAIIPALVVTTTQGDAGIDDLLVLSQVVLGVLLPFAVWPLVWFTSSKRIMTVRYIEGNGSRYSVDENTIHEMADEAAVAGGSGTRENRVFEVVYANSWPFTIVVVTIATAVTALNLFLLISVVTK